MGSSRAQDRSLGGGTFLPQWMKGKADSRFDFNESTFSPPSHDDSFFFIRYPKSQQQETTETKEGFRPIDEVLSNKSEPTVPPTNTIISSEPSGSVFHQVKNIDFSKHPLSCQPFITPAAKKGTEARIVFANKSKPLPGAEDELHGESAQCGRSIVHVANQIMSSRFGKAYSAEAASDVVDHSSVKSKSLPATPLTSPLTTPDSSPKSRRRVSSNRFFTGAFIPDRERFQNGWLLGSILGQTRDFVATKIDEEDELSPEPLPPRALSRKKSISSQNLTYVGLEEKMALQTNLEAKPTELREMNFWSPTSM